MGNRASVLVLLCFAVVSACAVAPSGLQAWDVRSGAHLDDRVVVTDPSGKPAKYDEVKIAVLEKLKRGRVQVKIFLFVRADKSLDWLGDMELLIAGATSETSGGAQLKTEALLVQDPDVPAGKIVRIGELFGKEVGADVDQVQCTVRIVEDDGIGTDQKQVVQDTLDDLKAFADSGAPGVGSAVVRYVPILPIFFDLVNWIFDDTRINPAPISLQPGQGFLPSAQDLAWSGGGFAIAYVVQVDGYLFASSGFAGDTLAQAAMTELLR